MSFKSDKHSSANTNIQPPTQRQNIAHFLKSHIVYTYPPYSICSYSCPGGMVGECPKRPAETERVSREKGGVQSWFWGTSPRVWGGVEGEGPSPARVAARRSTGGARNLTRTAGHRSQSRRALLPWACPSANTCVEISSLVKLHHGVMRMRGFIIRERESEREAQRSSVYPAQRLPRNMCTVAHTHTHRVLFYPCSSRVAVYSENIPLLFSSVVSPPRRVRLCGGVSRDGEEVGRK